MSTPILYALIQHVSEARLLLIPTSNGWMLPRLSSTDPPAVAQDLRAQFGIDTIVLGTVYDRYDDEMDPIEQIYVVEQRAGTLVLPDGARWAGREELEHLPLAAPAHRSVLTTWLAERAGQAVPPERPPWASPGWFAQAEAWIGHELRRLDTPLAGALEQERVSPTSCVLRVPGAAHTLYFKASAPVFGYEPALTAALGELWPEAVPRVHAMDAERGWMLLEDAGPSLREITRQDRDLRRWEAMLRQFARLQMESAAHLERLQALGCPDRRLGRLPFLFDELLREPARLLIGQAGGLSEAEYAGLRALQPELEVLCERLAAYNIPATLHHDDFSASNIGVRGGQYVFFDWAESCLAHPFFSLIIVLRVAHYILRFDAAELDRLRDTYLSMWVRYTAMDELREAWRVALRLGTFCRALTWHTVAQSVEPRLRPEYQAAATAWLQMLLENGD